MVYTRAHSWWTVLGLDKCIMIWRYRYTIIQSSFIALKILCVLPIHLLLSNLCNLLSYYCPNSYTFSRMSYSWSPIWYVVFPNWILSLNMFNFSLFFHNLVALFFLALNKISLSEFTVEFIHLPTEGCPGCFLILTYMNRAAISIACRFLCRPKFSTSLVWFLDCVVKSYV